MSKGSKMTEERKERIRQTQLANGAKSRGELTERIREVMRSIDKEIEDAEDHVYPENDGVLNQRELARRVGVHYTLFNDPNYSEFLLNEIKPWLTNHERKDVVRKLEVRRTLTERVADWKELCGAFVDAIRVSELDRQQAEAEVLKLKDDVRQFSGERDSMFKMLEATKMENEELRRALQAASGGKVVSLHRNERAHPSGRDAQLPS